MRRALSRRLVALVTAYAVALNILLPIAALAAAPDAGDPTFIGTLCSSGAHQDGSRVPADQGPFQSCCGVMCAACGHAATSTLDELAYGEIAYQPPARSVAAPVRDEAEPPLLHIPGSNGARAPPAPDFA